MVTNKIHCNIKLMSISHLMAKLIFYKKIIHKQANSCFQCLNVLADQKAVCKFLAILCKYPVNIYGYARLRLRNKG